MQQTKPNLGLYGISAENSNRFEQSLWGKNQFNTAFPLSLCIFMRDKGLSPISVLMQNGEKKTDEFKWDMNDVIGSANDKNYYYFEEKFQPYQQLFYGNEALDKIDLIVESNEQPIAPYEVKLTVVPDISTVKFAPELWSPEIVVRPVSSAYAMMGIANYLLNSIDRGIKNQVFENIKEVYKLIIDWENQTELIERWDVLNETFKTVIKILEPVQEPFLIQPIWRTNGQSLELSEDCFDVFVWSNLAVLAIPGIELDSKQSRTARRVTRMFREIARHIRSLYEIN